jgi:hypothetical protein
MTRTGVRSAEVPLFDVELEGVVYTLVDVHEGHDADFERWYESDHFYSGGVLGRSVLSGRRWYASKALRDARFVGDDCLLPAPYQGTNLATYWLTRGGLDAFYEWVRPTLMSLRADGRMFADRTHVNTDGYRVESVLDFPHASAVRPHVALDHPFPGLFVAYLEPDATATPDPSAPVPDGSLVVGFRPNVGSLSAESIGVTEAQPGMTFPTGGEPVRMVLAFLTEPPEPSVERSAGLTRALARLTGSKPLWGGGFLPVVPGSLGHLPELR